MSLAGERDRDEDRVPRAMIHRRILDVAGDAPDASMEAIADEVSGASIDLVERVIEEYGDPADRETASGSADGTTGSGHESTESPTDDGPADASGSDVPTDAERGATDGTTDAERGTAEREETVMSQNATEPSEGEPNGGGETRPDPDDLTEKQWETVRAVYENPGAPQEVIADRLGVTRATVSRRLNDLPGFEWSERKAFAESLFEDAETGTPGDGRPAETVAGNGVSSDGGSETSPAAGNGASSPAGNEDETGNGNEAGNGSEAKVGTTAESGADPSEAIADLERRVAAIEGNAESRSLPPELVHKVLHACMESDRISEDEELELLRAFV